MAENKEELLDYTPSGATTRESGPLQIGNPAHTEFEKWTPPTSGSYNNNLIEDPWEVPRNIYANSAN